MSESQHEFLFADGPAPELHPPDPRAPFIAEVSAAWQIPVGEKIHVDLSGHSLSDLKGRIELARAPDLPLDPRQPLALHIGGIEFSSRQITAWSLL
jgi:hypothetical protein